MSSAVLTREVMMNWPGAVSRATSPESPGVKRRMMVATASRDTRAETAPSAWSFRTTGTARTTTALFSPASQYGSPTTCWSVPISRCQSPGRVTVPGLAALLATTRPWRSRTIISS